MIIEVNEASYELDWRSIAVLLALRWVRFNALPFSRLQAVEPDPGRLKALVSALKEMGLVEEFKVGRSTIIFLTEKGAKVAEKLEAMAKEAKLV